MIILHQNKNKIYLAYFLTLVFFVAVLVAWQNLSPSSQAASAPVVDQATVEPSTELAVWDDLAASLELAKLQWANMQNQLSQDQQRQKLLASVQAFLNNQSSSTPTSTTQSSSTATTSIK